MARYRHDSNQIEIVTALRQTGATVTILSGVGGGVPDLFVGWRGINLLLEVKNLEGRGKRLTLAEREFMENWHGQVAIVEDIAGAVAFLDIIK